MAERPARPKRRRVRAPTPETLNPVRPNAGIKDYYYSQLDAAIGAMQKSVSFWVKAVYNRAGVASDAAAPATAMQRELAKLNSKWQSVFDKLARRLSKQLARRWTAYSDGSLKAQLRARGFSVEFRATSAMRDAYQAVHLEQINLIRSIPRQCLTEVSSLVYRSVLRGRDLHTLSEQLQHRFHVTRDRAALIARDQNNKATAAMTGARQESLGITEGIWRHSGAGKEPRPSHVKASGTKFTIKQGLYLDGEWVRPGEAINCRCTWSPIIPGLTRTH